MRQHLLSSFGRTKNQAAFEATGEGYVLPETRKICKEHQTNFQVIVHWCWKGKNLKRDKCQKLSVVYRIGH